MNYLYYFEAEDCVKIGATKNINTRLSQHRQHKITYIRIYEFEDDSAFEIEKLLHRILAKYRIDPKRPEWYDPAYKEAIKTTLWQACMFNNCIEITDPDEIINKYGDDERRDKKLKEAFDRVAYPLYERKMLVPWLSELMMNTDDEPIRPSEIIKRIEEGGLARFTEERRNMES